MTDNEKRAHDLAVAASIDICRTEKEIPVDYFTAYMGVYENALEIFNEKFPNGK